MLRFIRTPVGKKLATGVTGIGLVLFVTGHMLGNLSMFFGDDAYNLYAHKLASLGPLLYLIEIGLVVFFLTHATIGFSIWLGKRKARPDGYDTYRSAGGASRQTTSSRSMILTGIILLVFLVFHLVSLKFGPGGPGNADASYLVTIDGVEMRDLAALVREQFGTAGFTFGYLAIMVLLMVHLRHGVWSGLQSLGALRPSMSGTVYTVGAIYGVLIGLGFLVMPLAVYFQWI